MNKRLLIGFVFLNTLFLCAQNVVDKNGLNRMDKRILTSIIDKFNGGPVGLSTIATAVAEEPGTLEEVVEPFLIQQGYLERTPRGRQVTKLAYEYLGKLFPGAQGTIF